MKYREGPQPPPPPQVAPLLMGLIITRKKESQDDYLLKRKYVKKNLLHLDYHSSLDLHFYMCSIANIVFRRGAASTVNFVCSFVRKDIKLSDRLSLLGAPVPFLFPIYNIP